MEELRQGLRDLGWVEGRTIALEVRNSEGRRERLPALAEELARLRVDVLVTSGAQAIRAAREATRTIPIVMARMDDADAHLKTVQALGLAVPQTILIQATHVIR